MSIGGHSHLRRTDKKGNNCFSGLVVPPVGNPRTLGCQRALPERGVLLPEQMHQEVVEWLVEGFALLPRRFVRVQHESSAYSVQLPEGQVRWTIVGEEKELRGPPPEEEVVETVTLKTSPTK